MTSPERHGVVRVLLIAALAATPAAAFAQTATVTGIETVPGEGLRLTIPSLETTGANLDETSIRAIFAGDFAGTAADLANLDAERIHIPEIRIDYEAPGTDGEPRQSTIVYRDFEMTGVADGVAQAASLGGGEVTAGTDAVWTFGPMSTGRLDIGGILGFYGLGGREGSEIRPIYNDFEFGGLTITSPQFNCEVGTARIAEFAARPLEHSFQEMLAQAQALEEQEAAGETPDPEAVADMIAFYIDFMTAFRSSPTEFDGFSCSGQDDEGNDVALSSGAITLDGYEPGIYPALSLDDFRIDVLNDGWMEFDSFTWKAMDFNGAIAAVEAAGTKLDEAWFNANWRSLMPVFDGFSLTGFGMDVPDEEHPGQRVRASIGAFDVALADYRNGIPATISMTASDLDILVPAGSADEGPDLAALGIDRLNLDYAMNLHWDETAETIVVDRLALAADSMGSIEVNATLGNATAELFSEDLKQAAAASEALTIKEIRIDLVDSGMSSVFIALAAAEENQEPAAFRAVLSGLAQAMPLALLGPSEESMGLGTALRAFIDGTPNLHLTLVSRDPGGIGLAEFEALEEDPTALLGKVSITAETSGEPRTPVELRVAPATASEPEPSAAPAETPPAAPARSPAQQEKQGSKQ